MQIRYLEAMQAMAKSANSKVIFLPAQNQTVQTQMAIADAVGEGPSKYHGGGGGGEKGFSDGHDFGMNAQGMQSAINAGMVQHI